MSKCPNAMSLYLRNPVVWRPPLSVLPPQRAMGHSRPHLVPAGLGDRSRRIRRLEHRDPPNILTVSRRIDCAVALALEVHYKCSLSRSPACRQSSTLTRHVSRNQLEAARLFRVDSRRWRHCAGATSRLSCPTPRPHEDILRTEYACVSSSYAVRLANRERVCVGEKIRCNGCRRRELRRCKLTGMQIYPARRHHIVHAP